MSVSGGENCPIFGAFPCDESHIFTLRHVESEAEQKASKQTKTKQTKSSKLKSPHPPKRGKKGIKTGEGELLGCLLYTHPPPTPLRRGQRSTEVRKEVNWCFTPSQPVRLYQGEDREAHRENLTNTLWRQCRQEIVHLQWACLVWVCSIWACFA